MTDMLVKLYEIEDNSDEVKKLAKSGVIIRRPIAPEKIKVVSWVKKYFGDYWASECDASFSQSPAKCFVAQKNGEILGFACYDSTYKAYFGPTGVKDSERGNGYGKVLLISALNGLKELGYAYGIIGGAGPVDFYKKVCGAITIEGSSSGIYKDML